MGESRLHASSSSESCLTIVVGKYAAGMADTHERRGERDEDYRTKQSNHGYVHDIGLTGNWIG